jgi:hypothetical protein
MNFQNLRKILFHTKELVVGTLYSRHELMMFGYKLPLA